jgi:hypothetical protein
LRSISAVVERMLHDTQQYLKEAEMKFINLTPHPVRLRPDTANTAGVPADGDIVVQPEQATARVPSTQGGEIGSADGIALFGRTIYGEVEGLPAPAADTIYIVSVMFAGRVGDRQDVFVPGTGPKDGVIRNAEGQVFAVTRLVQA